MTDGAATSCKWTEGLTKKGDYYEGVVVDAERYLQLHAACTITTYGTRTSWKADLPFRTSASETTTDRKEVCINPVEGQRIFVNLIHSYMVCP